MNHREYWDEALGCYVSIHIDFKDREIHMYKGPNPQNPWLLCSGLYYCCCAKCSPIAMKTAR